MARSVTQVGTGARAGARAGARVEADSDRGMRIGRAAVVSLAVSCADTAESAGSGDVPVLSTPRLVALCEEACCRALDGCLDPGTTSVASRIRFDHLLPVPVGRVVTAEATLKRVEGRRMIFAVCCRLDSGSHTGPIGAGLVTRVVVDRKKFLSRAGPPGSD